MRRIKEAMLTFPSFCWLFFFFIVPACLVYILAFKTADYTGKILPGWSLETFYSLFDSRSISLTIRTMWLSILTTGISIFIAVPLSYYMASCKKELQQKLLLSLMIPLWSSFLVRIFAWKVVLHPEGLVKTVLVFIGIIDEQTILLYNDIAIVIVMVYSYFPFAVLPLYSTASKFDFQLFEAAMDLGATKRKSFFSIYLPVIFPSILTASLMVLIPAAGAYVIPEIVGGNGAEMLGNTIVRRVFLDNNLPEASTLSLLLSVVVLIPAIVIATWKASHTSQIKGYS